MHDNFLDDENFVTVSGNIPAIYESALETNNLLSEILELLKSDSVSSNNPIDVYGTEYRNKISETLNNVEMYLDTVSGNSVSGNNADEEFYMNVGSFIEATTLQMEESNSYLNELHGTLTVLLCGLGLVFGILFASLFVRWWKHG